MICKLHRNTYVGYVISIDKYFLSFLLIAGQRVLSLASLNLEN